MTKQSRLSKSCLEAPQAQAVEVRSNIIELQRLRRYLKLHSKFKTYCSKYRLFIRGVRPTGRFFKLLYALKDDKRTFKF